MKPSEFLIFPLVFLLFSAPSAGAQIIGGDGWSIQGTDPIEIRHGNKAVTSYHAGYDAGKPYFYPILGPTGENMTRHWPMKEGFEDEETDHPHHRGMWYGLGNVNGFDFWHFAGNNPKPGSKGGVIRHRGMSGVMIKGPALLFKTKSEWLEAADPERRICSDQREFTLFYREDGSLVIDLHLTLIADAGDVTIGDDKEGAWAIRVIPTLRVKGKVAKGRMLNSEGLTDSTVWGKQAAWVAYSGADRAGNTVGIAMLDHPSNFRHPTWWHARDYGLFAVNPFGQGHFEKDAPENAGEHVIANGESLSFRYRTLFHKGNAEEAKIQEAFEAFSSK